LFTPLALAAVLFSGPAALAQTFSVPPQQKTSTYVSEVKTAPFIFSALAATWDQKLPPNSSADLDARFQDLGGQWSQWNPLSPDLDGKVDADPNHPTAFIAVNPTKNFQYRVVLAGTKGPQSPVVENLKFTYINSGDPVTPLADAGNSFAASTPGGATATTAAGTSTATNPTALNTDLSTVKIISRAEWGADESLRVYNSKNPPPTLVIGESSDYVTKYADELKIVRTVTTDAQGNNFTWPEQFPAKVTKIIIHHTASTQDINDPMKAVRDIYYFHTVTRGWGDIGYNYLIDPLGNIYEGRAGGDGVVGAHAGPGNIGSIGIAVIGNYQDNNVPDPVIHSLVALIREKTQEYNIDPLGDSMFRGQDLPNIMGHRDIMSTTCPGDNLYAQLPAIRLAVKTGFKAVITDRAPNLIVDKQNDYQISQNISAYEFDPGQPQQISLTLKNSGTTTWNKNTFFVMNRNDNANNYFLSDGVVGSNTAGKDIPPGQSAVFNLTVQAGYKAAFTTLEVFPMIDGNIKVEKYLSIPVVVRPAVFDYQLMGITLPKPFMKVGEQATVDLQIKNTGNFTWQRDGKNHFALGTDEPRDHVNKLLLTPSNRLATLQESQVKPGDVGHLSFKIKAPAQTGPYKEFFTPLLEGVAWFENKNSALNVYVYEKDISGIMTGTSSDSSFTAGQQQTIWFDVENVGGQVWNRTGANSMTFTVRNPKNIQISGPTMQQDQVAPGDTAHVLILINVPKTEGFYSLQIQPKIGSVSLFSQAKGYYFHVAAAPTGSAAPAVPAQSAFPTTSSQQAAQTQASTQAQSGSQTQTSQTPAQSGSQTPASQAQTAANARTPASIADSIRIALSYQGSPVITANGPFHIESGGKTIASLAANQTVPVTYSGGYIVQTPTQTFNLSDPPRFVPDSGAILQIQNWNRAASGNSSIVYNQFRGILEPHWYNSQLVTINELPIELYLKGTGEISDSQPYEKIKAMIVVARTYALFYVKMAQKFIGAPYNLTDDPQTSQKYIGYSLEAALPNTQRAITDTAGEVVTYQGQLVKTPYFSSDDGNTRSAESVWGWTNTPYLVSVPDPYCKGMTMNGHGVGLSGCGALGMAQAGKTYQDIIKYYYQGVEVKKLYN
jgi:hypothetical protein